MILYALLCLLIGVAGVIFVELACDDIAGAFSDALAALKDLLR